MPTGRLVGAAAVAEGGSTKAAAHVTAVLPCSTAYAEHTAGGDPLLLAKRPSLVWRRARSAERKDAAPPRGVTLPLRATLSRTREQSAARAWSRRSSESTPFRSRSERLVSRSHSSGINRCPPPNDPAVMRKGGLFQAPGGLRLTACPRARPGA